MESLGLSLEDLHPTGPLNSRRALARAQSAQIMSKKFLQRDRVKQEMKAEEAWMLIDATSLGLGRLLHKEADYGGHGAKSH